LPVTVVGIVVSFALNRPLTALGHRKPIDVLAGGGYEELSRLVAALESPTFT